MKTNMKIILSWHHTPFQKPTHLCLFTVWNPPQKMGFLPTLSSRSYSCRLRSYTFLLKALLDVFQASQASTTNFQCCCPNLLTPPSVPVTGWLHPSHCRGKNFGLILDCTLVPTPPLFHQQSLSVPSYLLPSFTGYPSPYPMPTVK